MTKISDEYKALRKKVLERKRRLEKRGYTLEVDVPKIPNRITKGSVARLEKFTTKYMYENSTYSYVEDGKTVTVSGRRGRYIEREKSAQKAQQTVKRKKAEALEEEWQRYRKDLDEKQKALFAAMGSRLRKAFYEGKLIYDGLLAEIDRVDRTHKASAEHVRSVLRQAIEQLGEASVMINIAKAPEEVKSAAQMAIYYPENSYRHDLAISELLRLILGRSLSAEELKALYDAIERDIYVP